MKLTKLIKLSVLGLGLAFAFSSCSEEKVEPKKRSSASAPELEALVLKEMPINAIDITDLRKTATPGTPVTFVGKVLGGKVVFMDHLAVMTVGDPNLLTTCDLKGGDCAECDTPWDVCCDEPDVIKANVVTVQVVDTAGKPVKSGLKGLNGLKELSEVVITGKVAKSSNKDNMIINATGIFVK